MSLSDDFKIAQWAWNNWADIQTLWKHAKPIVDLSKAEAPTILPIVKRLFATLDTGGPEMSVENIQKALTRAGHTVVVDGKMGPRTHDATSAFQAEHGLTADGWVGPETWAVLESFMG